MADNPQNFSSVTSALATLFRPRVVRTINRRSVALKALRIERNMTGKSINVDVEFDGMVTETFNDGDDATNFGSDAVAPATLNYGLVRSNFRVTDLAQAAAQATGNPADLARLWGRNIVNAATKLASTLNGQAFSGDGSSNKMTGFDTAVDDSNTYMGIDRSQSGNAGFRGNVIDPGTPTAPTLDLIRGDIADTIYTECGEQPDIAFVSPAGFIKLGSLFTEMRRYPQPVGEIQTARGRVLLDASVGALEFEGCTFIKDKDCTANEIVYVNSEYAHFEYLEQNPEMPLAGEISDEELEDGFGPIPLGAKLKHLGPTGSSEKATMQVFVNLVVEKPNTCGRRVNCNFA